mmetsp:Transcript_69328/g.212536  ORF Transcript_69328/g.212536 Transcript_69328/m.212536 type:complete len:153 (-) Transcript_69328:589-1047(-)
MASHRRPWKTKLYSVHTRFHAHGHRVLMGPRHAPLFMGRALAHAASPLASSGAAHMASHRGPWKAKPQAVDGRLQAAVLLSLMFTESCCWAAKQPRAFSWRRWRARAATKVTSESAAAAKHAMMIHGICSIWCLWTGLPVCVPAGGASAGTV